jgi:hypothetical protein
VAIEQHEVFMCWQGFGIPEAYVKAKQEAKVTDAEGTS